MVWQTIKNWLMNYTKSLLSRDDSTWLKGLLTLLIVLGHDMVFTIPLKEYGAMSFLYLFHIQSFFLLPFLYGIDAKAYTWKRGRDMFVRYYWPYFSLATLMILCYGAASHFSSFTLERMARLLIFCDSTSIKRLCGIQILWFLPCMMSMALLKELYYRGSKGVRLLLLLASFAFILWDICANSSLHALSIRAQFLQYVPLGAGYAIQLLAQGVVLRVLVDYVEIKKKYICALIVSIIGFIVCSALYMEYVACFIGVNSLNVVYTLLKNVTPILFMLMVVSCQNLRKAERYGSGIYKIGTRSLFVYLISPFVGYVTYFICSALGLMYWWVGLLLWPIIVYLAYWMSLLVKGKFEMVMFPRNYETLRRFVIRNRCAL